jgi:hypothetical protein
MSKPVIYEIESLNEVSLRDEHDTVFIRVFLNHQKNGILIRPEMTADQEMRVKIWYWHFSEAWASIRGCCGNSMAFPAGKTANFTKLKNS